MLGASTLTTLRRVVLPLLKPALVAALTYSFVRSMTTVSAVIFLYGPDTKLASIAIVRALLGLGLVNTFVTDEATARRGPTRRGQVAQFFKIGLAIFQIN